MTKVSAVLGIESHTIHVTKCYCCHTFPLVSFSIFKLFLFLYTYSNQKETLSHMVLYGSDQQPPLLGFFFLSICYSNNPKKKKKCFMDLLR